MTGSGLHVIFGGGQIGSRLARTLRDLRLRVRVIRRSGRAVGDGIEVVAGDARDPALAIRACAGAAVVYHCMNPSRYRARVWEQEFPALGESVIAGARAAGARLVVLDNLYGYGPKTTPLAETTPMTPIGRKAAVRAAWAARLRAARGEGLRVVVGRAGDFFGPGAEDAVLGEDAVRRLAAGRRPLVFGDPAAPHAFGFVPDVVAALAALGTADEDPEDVVFHLPVSEISPRELLDQIATALGVPARRFHFGPALVVLTSPFVSVVRELRETMYQWDRPFRVSDARFRARFPSIGTSIDDAIAQTAASARGRAIDAARAAM